MHMYTGNVWCGETSSCIGQDGSISIDASEWSQKATEGRLL